MVVSDEAASWSVVASETPFQGTVIGVRRDTLDHAGETFVREVVTHPGAVAVLAIDDNDRVLTLRQYRHPAQHVMVELPAGLLDIHEESPLDAAKRELHEEALLVADRWTPMFQTRPSAGSSTEIIHVFLAEGLQATESPADFVAQHEEAAMTREWVPLDELVAAVMAGEVTNGLTITGSLAVWHLRHRNRLPNTD